MTEFEGQPDTFASEDTQSQERFPVFGSAVEGTELEREADCLRLAIGNLREYAVVGIDQNHSICTWNEGARQMFGWEEQEIAGKPAKILFTSEDIENGAPDRQLDAALREQSIEEERWHIRKDGTRFWGSGTLSVMWGSSGSVHGFVKIVRDVTTRKRAEEELRDSEEKFRLFVENVTDYALIQVDPERNISGWNTGAERSFGYSEEEIIGQPMNVLFTPEDVNKGDPDKDFEEALGAGRAEYERWLVRKDGSRFWARWVTTPMYDQVGRLRGYAKVLHDETQRKDAQDQQRKALEEKNALLQEVHHRVKNNLQVISSLLSLQADGLDHPQTLAVLEDTQSRVAAIAAIHEQLYASKDLSSIEFGPYLQTLVRGLFGLHGAKKDRIALKVDAADVVLNVQQAMPLGLIVNELVINALKHAFPQNRSGVIAVSLSYTPANTGGGGNLVQDDLVRLMVEDNGVGLAPGKDVSQVQSMGFNLVNLLVQQLHGELEISRGPGLSVTVTFCRNN